MPRRFRAADTQEVADTSTFDAMMTPTTFLQALDNVDHVESQPQQLPDLRALYPTTIGEQGTVVETLARQADRYMEWARNFFVDAMCIHLLANQITISLPLLLGPEWERAPDPSKVAHALFVSWVHAEAQET